MSTPDFSAAENNQDLTQEVDCIKALMALMLEMHQRGQTVLAVLHDNQRVMRYFPQTLFLGPDNLSWGATRDVLPAFDTAGQA